jgi:hypothetical protein
MRRSRYRTPPYRATPCSVKRSGRTDEPRNQEATVKRYHYETHDQLRQHLADFVAAYNDARRLTTPLGLTPYEAICKAWAEDPVDSCQARTRCGNSREQLGGLKAPGWAGPCTVLAEGVAA